MMRSTKWLLCCGPHEYLVCAEALVKAGHVGGVEWEPVAARAASRISQLKHEVPYILVADGIYDMHTQNAVNTFGNLVQNPRCIVHVVDDPLYERNACCGVTVVGIVELFDLLQTFEADDEGDDSHGCWDGDPVPDAVLDDIYVCELPEALVNEELNMLITRGASGGSNRFSRENGLTPKIYGTFAAREETESNAAHLRGIRASGMLSRIPSCSTDADAVSETGIPGAKQNDTYIPKHSISVVSEADSVEIVDVQPSACIHLGLSPGSYPVIRAENVLAQSGDIHIPTICMASARGGVGKSSIATLAALTLAREGFAVALIDLDFQFGTCLGYLGSEETDGLFDAGQIPSEILLDNRTLARCRCNPEPGLAGYEFCSQPEYAELLGPLAKDLILAASAQADIAIVDLPCGVGEAAAQAFEIADRCLLVSDRRALALESLGAQHALCVRMGIPRTKLISVINRCDPRHRDESFFSRASFELQTPQILRVADGGSEVAQLMSIGSAGELVALRNKFALSAADLIHTICADLGCALSQTGSGRLTLAAMQLAPSRQGKSNRFWQPQKSRQLLSQV